MQLPVCVLCCPQNGWTALHLAAWGGREANVRALLDMGADKDAKNNKVCDCCGVAMALPDVDVEASGTAATAAAPAACNAHNGLVWAGSTLMRLSQLQLCMHIRLMWGHTPICTHVAVCLEISL